jgi:SAM-dependent methyltransferase
MSEHDWNAHYASGELPWDSPEPDNHLVELVLQRPVAPARALEVGCGTGTNSLWLAAQGFNVQAVDLAPLAIERAQKKAAAAKQASVKFEQHDFLKGPELPAGSFQLVFDRGVLHVFDAAEDQQLFAERVSKALGPGGLWLSILGSTEGPAREMGPPRRNAREIVAAIEPALEILELRAVEFGALPFEKAPKAWLCLARKRDVAAQPSSKLSEVTDAIRGKRP